MFNIDTSLLERTVTAVERIADALENISTDRIADAVAKGVEYGLDAYADRERDLRAPY